MDGVCDETDDDNAYDTTRNDGNFFFFSSARVGSSRDHFLVRWGISIDSDGRGGPACRGSLLRFAHNMDSQILPWLVICNVTGWIWI